MKRLWLVLGVLLVTLISIAFFVVDHLRNITAPLASEATAGPSMSPTGLEITYIANEGVLISAGDKQVLIDGLHREYERDYAFLPTVQREKIETAQAPFHQIDLILVSHRHLDHFHPESVHNVAGEAELLTAQSVYS